MHIEKHGQLYNIHPSLHLDSGVSLLLVKKLLDVAVSKKAPIHFWFHLWSFGDSKKSIRNSIHRLFSPFLKYAKEKENRGVLVFETMLSAAEKAQRSVNTR
jgi:hypothetical protein